jgi:hypothetical protein
MESAGDVESPGIDGPDGKVVDDVFNDDVFVNVSGGVSVDAFDDVVNVWALCDPSDVDNKLIG